MRTTRMNEVYLQVSVLTDSRWPTSPEFRPIHQVLNEILCGKQWTFLTAVPQNQNAEDNRDLKRWATTVKTF